MLSKYKTIHILLTNMHLDCRREGSSNRNASRDESVEARDESIEAGEKTQQSCYNTAMRWRVFENKYLFHDLFRILVI